jgi:hypothetical protein
MVINDPDPDVLAAHALLTTSAHGIGGEWFSTYLDRGVTRSGITVGQAGYFFEDFTDMSRWRKEGGVAVPSASLTTQGGVAQIAAAATDDVQYTTGSAAFGMATLFSVTGRFYMATRIRVNVGAAADGIAMVSGFNAPPTALVQIGYVGAHGANFCVATNDGLHPQDHAVSTVPAADGNWHNLEGWGDGTNYYLSVDGGATVTLVPTNPPAGNVYPFIETAGGVAAGTTCLYDKVLYVFPQAA